MPLVPYHGPGRVLAPFHDRNFAAAAAAAAVVVAVAVVLVVVAAAAVGGGGVEEQHPRVLDREVITAAADVVVVEDADAEAVVLPRVSYPALSSPFPSTSFLSLVLSLVPSPPMPPRRLL